MCRLEEVISKYAIKQEDTEEQERTKRLEKNSKETAVCVEAVLLLFFLVVLTFKPIILEKTVEVT